jgi:erythromycin esterase
MLRIRCSLFLFLVSLTACAQPASETEWLEENTFELQIENGYDFDAIKEAIGDKRIVGIGESTHGLGSYYTMKSELVKYLHEEMGFEVLAMEGGLGDIELAYEDIDTIPANSLRDYSVFGNFRALEANPLFAYIKETSTTQNPLLYTGYDTQASSNYLFTKLQRLIRPYHNQLADSLFSNMYKYQKSYQAGHEGNEEKYKEYRDIFRTSSLSIKKILEDNHQALRDQGESEHALIIMKRSLTMFAASTDLSYEERFRGSALRDELMVLNFEWLLKEVYPGKKIIVWAHNGHVEKAGAEGNNIKWMGHALKENHGDNYYSIGLFAYQGENYQFWTQKNIPFHNTGENNLEQRIANTQKEIAFLPLDTQKRTTWNEWLYKVAEGYELENGGTIRFVPAKRFDGVICLRNGLPPTYKQ